MSDHRCALLNLHIQILSERSIIVSVVFWLKCLRDITALLYLSLKNRRNTILQTWYFDIFLKKQLWEWSIVDQKREQVLKILFLCRKITKIKYRICDLAITDIFWHEYGCLHEIFIFISSSIYLRLWYFGSCQLQRLFPKMLLVISAPSTHPPHSCVCCAVCTCQAAYHTCRPEEIKLGRNTRATPYQEKLTKLYHRDNENMKLFGSCEKGEHCSYLAKERFKKMWTVNKTDFYPHSLINEWPRGINEIDKMGFTGGWSAIYMQSSKSK